MAAYNATALEGLTRKKYTIGSMASRRDFLTQLSVASMGVLAPDISWADERSSRRVGVARRSLNRVARILDGYSDAYCLCGLSAVVEATSGDSAPPAHILTKISNEKSIHAFFTQQGGLPFRRVYVEGNTMSFRFGSRDFIVENLANDAYQNRISHIHTQGNLGGNVYADYAHQYATYNLKTKRLKDPYGTISAGKPVLRSACNVNLSTWTLTSVIQGLVDSVLLDAEPGKVMQNAWQKFLLETRDLSDELAEQVIIELLPQLTVMANDLVAEDISRLLCSKRVDTSVRRVFHADSSTIVRNYQNLQRKANRGTAPRVLWLAAILTVTPSAKLHRLLRDAYLMNSDLTIRRSASDDWRKAMRLI